MSSLCANLVKAVLLVWGAGVKGVVSDLGTWELYFNRN